MDIKLESLIAKIKKDGIDEAKKTSVEIIEKAKGEAKAIIEEAQAQAQNAKIKAETSALKLESNAKASLKQAARDLTLALKSELRVLFERVLKDNVGQALSPDFMRELIVKIVNKWPAKKDSGKEVLANKVDKEKLEKLLLESLRKEAKTNIIEVKISKAVDRGFRIGMKGEDFYYDFTDQSILEALKQFLNPALRTILDTSNE